MLIKVDSEVLYLLPSWRLLKQFGSLSQPPWVSFKGPVSPTMFQINAWWLGHHPS